MQISVPGHCASVWHSTHSHLAFCDSDREAALLELNERWPNAGMRGDSSGASALLKQVFQGRKGRRVSLTLKGTPFQLKVWEALLKIPEGHVRTYADIARSVGSAEACRAVGSAVGQPSGEDPSFFSVCSRLWWARSRRRISGS